MSKVVGSIIIIIHMYRIVKGPVFMVKCSQQ